MAQAQYLGDPDGRYSGGQTTGKRYELFGGMSYVGAIRRQTVAAPGNYAPGTIIVNTTERRLYLVQDGGRRSLRHRRRPRRLHLGGHHIGRRQEGMAGLDAALADAAAPSRPAALHEGRPGQSARRARDVSRRTLYRIHGSNEPETIGQAVSSGCFRMTNDDVIDLYDRVKVGAKVIVLR